MAFAGLEALLVPWYRAQLPTARLVTELPADLQTQVPLIQVTALSNLADPAVTRWRLIRWVLHVFDADDLSTGGLAEQAVTASMALRGVVLPGATVTDVKHDSGPAWVPYANPAVRQYVSTFNGRALLS